MKCRICGAEISSDTTLCPICGQPVVEENVPLFAQSPISQDTETGREHVSVPGRALGIISLILGAVGMVLGVIYPCACCSSCCAAIGNLPFLLMSVAAILLGAIGNTRAKKAGIKNTNATVGIIFGISGASLTVIALVLSFFVGTLANCMNLYTMMMQALMQQAVY